MNGYAGLEQEKTIYFRANSIGEWWITLLKLLHSEKLILF
jgi:hypothetical protein